MRTILIALLLIAATTRQLRFADAEEMRRHHHHEHNHRNHINGPITAWIMPHSHDDVGWLKTVDDYYYGGDMSTQWAGVQYTIDSVVSQLALDPTYKFSIVEVAFLYRWWNNANQTMRDLLTAHINNKQLEIINAGWCMSDEASPYYEDIIDQMTIGLRWVKDTFGVVPKIGWHIDPFGHQATNAALFNQFGFNAWFFARIDRQDKSLRMSNKGMQMIWHPTQYSGIDNSIFTHVNYYHYSPPPGFCFDIRCNADPIRDDPTLDGYNLEAKSQQLVDYFKNMSLHFRSSNLFHTIGEDFTYADARMWFKNFDKLLKYINARPQMGVTIKYATPSEYLQAIHNEMNTYPTKYDDFFPYSDCEHCYWTGYFTSRTSLKSYIKELGRYVTSVRNHLALLKFSNSSAYINSNASAVQQALWKVQMSLGILQHHDAVAGTAKQKVTNNYIVDASKSWAELNKFYNEIRKQQAKIEIGENIVTFNTNTTWNLTQHEWGIASTLASNKSVLLNLYNPGAKGTYSIRIKIDEREINIIGSNNTAIAGDIICSNIKDTKDCELFFNLAFEETSSNYVKLVPVKSGGSVKIAKLKQMNLTESTHTFDVTSTASLKFTKATQQFALTIPNGTMTFFVAYNYYESFQSNGQASGAYIFRPSNLTYTVPKKYSTIKTLHYAEGALMTVLVLQGDKTYTVIYLNRRPAYLQTYGFELETFVGTIDVSDKQGKQVILALTTNLANNKTFYTDSNGLEQQKRVVDFRPTWPLIVDEPVSGNYYPINSHISLTDVNTKMRLSLMNDRAQGGGVVKDGSVEIMIQRRLTHDDGRGVGEPLDEGGIQQKVRHYVVIGDQNRVVQKWNDQKIVISWADTATSTFAKHTTPKPAFPVPETVKLYMRPFADGTYLLRLMNFHTATPTQVTIPQGWQITEQTLGYNQLIEDWQKARYTWKEENYELFTGDEPVFDNEPFEPARNGIVDLKPFQIRTFKLENTSQ